MTMIVRHMLSGVFGLLIGAMISWVAWAYHADQHSPVIGPAENARSLEAAIDAYEQWQKGKGDLPRVPSTRDSAFARAYREQERERFASLRSELEPFLTPSSGSGGVNVRYLYDLLESQERVLELWLEADGEGRSSDLEEIARQIEVNYGSLERSVMLFKLLLGKNNHGH